MHPRLTGWREALVTPGKLGYLVQRRERGNGMHNKPTGTRCDRRGLAPPQCCCQIICDVITEQRGGGLRTDRQSKLPNSWLFLLNPQIVYFANALTSSRRLRLALRHLRKATPRRDFWVDVIALLKKVAYAPGNVLFFPEEACWFASIGGLLQIPTGFHTAFSKPQQ